MGTPAFNKNIYVYNNLLKKKKKTAEMQYPMEQIDRLILKRETIFKHNFCFFNYDFKGKF